MAEFIPQEPETVFLGYNNMSDLYIREGLFTKPKIVKPTHKEYKRLINLLDGERTKQFSRKDIEYRFLVDIIHEGDSI